LHQPRMVGTTKVTGKSTTLLHRGGTFKIAKNDLREKTTGRCVKTKTFN